jgi:Dolichyl-phosphate-mannose-protein mannosyltransferase
VPRAGPGLLDRPHAAGRGRDARPAERPGLERLLCVRGWPVAVVLVVQALLSLRLIRSATAFIDEGEYLTVGHLELAHYLHHAAIPDVASYLSGSPVVYPPLAAVADAAGGLAAARLLSLAFMLIATLLLHGVTRRLLSSRTAAFFAAALFGWLGTAQFLGAFATYDAMALMLLALATWLGVRAVEEGPALRYPLICAGGLSMAVADAAKYASALFNPVVIVVAALAAWRLDGRKAGLDAGGAMLLSAALPLTVGYDLAGKSFSQGLTSTTLTRARGTSSVGSVLALSAHATGIITGLAVAGAVVITAERTGRPDRPGWPTVTLAWALAGAVFLAPAEQARIHTLTSLFKHVGYGAWFAGAMAGYLLARLPALLAARGRPRAAHHPPPATARPRPRWAVRAGIAAGAVVVLLAGAVGVIVADGQYGDWPDSRPMIAELAKLVRPGGHYLVEDPSVVTYYLRSKVDVQRVDSTYTFFYTDPQTRRALLDVPAYADAIARGYFNAIVLNFGDTNALDQLIAPDISRNPEYRVVATIGYRDGYGPGNYVIWLRVPPGHPAAPRHVAPRGPLVSRRHHRR